MSWNFPYWVTRDDPVGTRHQDGQLWECGPGANSGGNDNIFTNELTVIGAFYIRTGWTDTSTANALHSIFSVGKQSAGVVWFNVIEVSGTQRLRIFAQDLVASTQRYDILIGDEDGTNWIQSDKWYSYAISVSNTAVSFVVNGSTTPKKTETTNSPGTLSMNDANVRYWLHGPTAAWGALDPSTITTVHGSSMLLGPMAIDANYVDWSSSTNRDRVFDANGDLIYPGDNGSKWFGSYSTSANFTPDVFLPNGAPVNDLGSAGLDWEDAPFGSSSWKNAPGGLRDQLP